MLPAGGILEAQVWPVWSLVSVRSPSGGGTLRSFFVMRSTSSSSKVRGSGELVVQAVPMFEDEDEGGIWLLCVSGDIFSGRILGSGARRLPQAMGLLQSKAC
jgi:hypothetical protein